MLMRMRMGMRVIVRSRLWSEGTLWALSRLIVCQKTIISSNAFALVLQANLGVACGVDQIHRFSTSDSEEIRAPDNAFV